MIISSWFIFHEKVAKILSIIQKKIYPLSFVDNQVKFFLENKRNEKNVTAKYCKLPYIGHISTDVKCKINRFCTFYCKNLNIKVVSFIVVDIFNVKDPVPKSLKSFAEYKFVCPHFNACYIDETFVNKN